MDNVPSSVDKHIISVRSFLKAAASATSIGAIFVSLMNDEQTRNIEYTLHKHQEQIEMLQEIVSGELHVDKAVYLEDLKAALQKAKDEANEEKRKLYASYLTACCHPENTENTNRRIFLDLVERIDFNGIRILKELTARYNGKKTIEYYVSLFEGELGKNDIIIQLDYLTSYRLVEKCTLEEVERFNARLGNVKTRNPISQSIYKRTALGEAFYQFISKGIL